MGKIKFNPHPDKKKEDTRYNLNDDTPKVEGVEEKVDNLFRNSEELEKFKKLDDSNPLEKAKKFLTVKNNPPKPGYMKVELFEDGKGGVVSKSDKNEFRENPFFVVDPYMLFQGNIAGSPINAVSNLLEMTKEVVRKEKVFNKEDRVKEFPWGWIIILLSFVPGIVLLLFWLL